MPRGLRAADRLPVLRLSVGMLAHQTPLPGLACSHPKTDTDIHPLNLSPTRVRPSYAWTRASQLPGGLLRGTGRAWARGCPTRGRVRADRGSRTHTARRPTSGYGGVPPAPAL